MTPLPTSTNEIETYSLRTTIFLFLLCLQGCALILIGIFVTALFISVAVTGWGTNNQFDISVNAFQVLFIVFNHITIPGYIFLLCGDTIGLRRADKKPIGSRLSNLLLVTAIAQIGSAVIGLWRMVLSTSSTLDSAIVATLYAAYCCAMAVAAWNLRKRSRRMTN